MFPALRAEVMRRRPVLEHILAERGNMDLVSYVRSLWNDAPAPAHLERREVFLTAFRAEAERSVGSRVAARAERQLRRSFHVATADHQGPVAHPWFLQPHLAEAAALAKEGITDGCVVTLCCSNVSLNNDSFPRGFLLHGADSDGRMREHRLSLLPSNAHASSACRFRPYGAEDVEKLRKLLSAHVREGALAPKAAERMSALLDGVYGRSDALWCRSFGDQMNKTNARLWERIAGVDGPAYVAVEQESLVARLLLARHMASPTLPHRLLFDAPFRAAAMSRLDGVPGAFDRAHGRGTYLLWAVDKDDNFRIPLWPEGDALVSEDGAVRIGLNPADIGNALQRGDAMPSLLLIFSTLAFHHGLRCLGGPNQVHYLTAMRDACAALLRESGDAVEADLVASVRTDGLLCDFHVASIAAGDERATASAADLVAYGDASTFAGIAAHCARMTLEEALMPEIAQYYRDLIPEAGRDRAFDACTTPAVLAERGAAFTVASLS